MNRGLRKMLVRFRVEPIGVAMPGPRLPQRIRGIVEATPIAGISRVRVALLIAACATICVTFFAVTVMHAQSPDMLAWEKAAGGKQSFDAASIKENTTPAPPLGPPMRFNMSISPDGTFKPTGGLFWATKIPLTLLISFAYKLTDSQTLVLASQAAHSADFKWALGEHWDIEARASGNPTKDQYRMMMQSLLANRFKLAVHWGAIQGPVYDVELQKPGKLGGQLTPHPADAPCSNAVSPVGVTKDELAGLCGGLIQIRPKPGWWRLSGRAVTMQQIVDGLSGFTPEPRAIVDRTGLAGTYDFSMEWGINFEGPAPPGYPATDPTAPSFLEALKDQLGLKLDPVTGPIDAIIIDHVEQPSPN